MTSPVEAAGRYTALAKEDGWHSTCFAALDFKHRALVDLLALWRRFALQGSVPRRMDLTPRVLRAHLGDIAIYERSGEVGRERYRTRVMGTRLSTVLGQVGGKYLDEAVPRKRLKRWHAAPDVVLEAGAPLRFLSRAELADKPFYTSEYLMAPLIGDGGEMDTVLASALFGPTVTSLRR
jgi:hypothetical protein